MCFSTGIAKSCGRISLPVIPDADVVEKCLNKWETYNCALSAGVPTPQCWHVESAEDVRTVIGYVPFPCVLKPLAAHYWRRGENWRTVGQRKAIAVTTPEQLLREYALTAQADARALIQELVPGGDDLLAIAACYFSKGKLVGGFTAQKVRQVPETFGTGCIVKTVNRPELFESTIRLLGEMQYTGIAEVEYKWDAVARCFKLIEVNPRPWTSIGWVGRSASI